MLNINKIVTVTSLVYLILLFALSSGAIHAIIEGSRTGQQFFLIPNRSTQTMAETVLSTLILFMGLGGLYLIHRSSKPQAAKAQKMYFVGGFAITAISLLAGFLLVGFKIG